MYVGDGTGRSVAAACGLLVLPCSRNLMQGARSFVPVLNINESSNV